MTKSRRRAHSASHYKATSKQVRNATLGNHVVVEGKGRKSQRMNAESVDFASARKSQRAARGYVDTIAPGSLSNKESVPHYTKNRGRQEYVQAVQRRSRARTVAIVLICVVVTLLVAGTVGVAAYFASIDSGISLSGSDASSALVSAEDDAAFYTLVAADLDLSEEDEGYGAPDALALVRVDEDSRRVGIISIPLDTQIELEDGSLGLLSEVAAEGDAPLIEAVAGLLGVSVSHYVELDADGVVALVDALGGVEIEVPEEVDDPEAGDLYLAAGQQTLDGESVLTLLRASNFSGGIETQCLNQRLVLSAVSLSLLGDGNLDFLRTLDGLDGAFQTDMGARAARKMAASLRGMGSDAVEGVLLPGSETTDDDDEECYVVSTDDAESLMERAEAGESLEDGEDEVELVDPGSFTITVRNGAGVDGGATQIADSLTELGFVVEETGNADSFVYTETLVIYTDEDYLAAAETVVESLGIGRVVDGGDYYSFDTDVLVVLGEDWTPTS